jgi:Tol biopolymer transport system component
MRTKVALVFVLGLLGLCSAPAATAVQRVENGQITFGRFDPALGDFSIWAANPDGTAQRRLTTMPSFFSDWSPDGGRIAFDFVDDVGVHVATMAPDGGDVRQLTFGPAIQEGPKWSPDGQSITFDAASVFPDDPAGFATAIWAMAADGSDARQVTRDGFDVEPVFSPDGRHIAFGRITGVTADGDQLEAVYLVDADGTHLRQVVAPLAGLEHPDWSPDGRWISFNIAPEAVRARQAGSVLVVHPNGKALHVLRAAGERFMFFKPVWSPDGRRLLVGCFDRSVGTDRLCVMPAHGGKVAVIIAEGQEPVNFPAWGSLPPAG